jgi:hypothetical protein
MSQTLSNLGTDKVEAIEQTNVTGQRTPILSFTPIDGMMLALRGSSSGGVGIPIYAKLMDSNGDDLPLDTELVLRYDAPHLDQPKVVSHKLSNLRVYRGLSIKEQQNADYRDRTRIELKGSMLEVRDIDEVQIAINSSKEIDWSKSRVYIDEQAAVVYSEG